LITLLKRLKMGAYKYMSESQREIYSRTGMSDGG